MLSNHSRAIYGCMSTYVATFMSLGWNWNNIYTLWEQTYRKQQTNWYLVNFTKYLVNVLKFTKYNLVNVHKIS